MAEKKKILIAEDEKPMSRALVLKLGNSGYEAKPAYDGQEALDMLAKEKFDLILLDLMMPRVDGFGVLEEMKKRGDSTPVICSTNLSQPSDIDRTKALGVIDYFVKSDTPISEVVDRVGKALSS